MYYWGKAVGRFELGMEAESCRSQEAGSRLRKRGSNQYPLPPSQKFFFFLLPLIYTEPRNVCIRTVLHECILTICTSRAALSETGANQCFSNVRFSTTVLVTSQIQKLKKAKYPTDPKPPVSTSPNKTHVALLQDFSAWARKAALFCNSIMLLEKKTL